MLAIAPMRSETIRMRGLGIVGGMTFNWKAVFLGEVDIPAEHRDTIGVAQRKRFHRLAPLAAVHGLLNAILLTFAFWSEPMMPIVFVWCYTSAVLVFLRFREGRRPPLTDGRKEDRRIIRYTVASGFIWGLVIWALVASSGP